MRDRAEGCGCLLMMFLVPACIILLILQAIFGRLGADHDDPYFQQNPPCNIPDGTPEPEPVDITNAGISPHCIESYDLAVSFTNQLTGRSVTLCLGQAGDCVSGHYSPFPGRRLTLRTGETQEITFPSGSAYGFGFDREYPVTVAASSGTPPSTAFDIIVEAKAGQPPDSGP